MLGQSLRLKPVPIQSLSELERARLQEVACCHLEKRELDCKISIPREIRKRRKSLRRRFDSFSKERKERESAPKAFGIALSQVIANDRAHKQRQDALKESRRDCLDLEASILHFRAEKQQQQQPPGSGKPPSPTAIPSLEAHGEPVSTAFLDNTSRAHRRGGMSVDCISDLVESQSRLLEALQLSHPYELEAKKAAGRGQGKLSLNPIYRQVPRVVELCCRHIEAHGLQTVGIFRVGSSKKRVRQLREDFDQGADVFLDREHSVHDVAALLKEFLRDMLDPLLPRELYPAFLHANSLRGEEQLQYLQLLLCLLPPCNCDTLWRLLSLLHTVHCHAQDTVGPDCQEVPGNKMTAANLAVIFGPNLLQKERGSEKDLSLQAVGMEDNSGVICVTLLLILHYKQLFMVSAELQQEVLVSLLQTDPDVINYLLRRKVSGSYPEMEVDAGGRRSTKSSLDSVGTSSWDSSPLEPPSSFYSETHEESVRSSEVLFNALRLQQIQNRSSEDRLGKSIGRIRQFHSHHNLLSLARPPPRALGEDRERAGKSGSWEEDSRAAKGGFAAERAVLFSVGENYREPLTLTQKDNGAWVKPRVMSAPGPEDGKPIATNLWDFLTRKVPSSETIL